jgi:hypothetical protein
MKVRSRPQRNVQRKIENKDDKRRHGRGTAQEAGLDVAPDHELDRDEQGREQGPQRNVRKGSRTEIPGSFGTSGNLRIAALALTSQVCQKATFARRFAIMRRALPATCVCHGNGMHDDPRWKWMTPAADVPGRAGLASHDLLPENLL